MHAIVRHTQARPRSKGARSFRESLNHVGLLAGEALALASLAVALFSGLVLLASALALA